MDVGSSIESLKTTHMIKVAGEALQVLSKDVGRLAMLDNSYNHIILIIIHSQHPPYLACHGT